MLSSKVWSRWPLVQRRLLTSRSTVYQPWFYASDVPKTKPYNVEYTPKKPPERFVRFSIDDCRRLETCYQRWIAQPNESFTVPVNEDLLFEVNLRKMELSPAYWKAPTYEVRRGLWFDSFDRPLAAELTQELEDHYGTMNFEAKESQRDVFKLQREYEQGSMVIFVDKHTAYILQDMDGGELQLSLIRANIAPSLSLKGAKVVRADIKQNEKDKKSAGYPKESQLGKLSDLITWELPHLLGSNETKPSDFEQKESELLSKEIESDYNNCGPSNVRSVKHLVLCVHGIGQNLGKKYEYVNFAHTINQLRSNMKKVYNESPTLKKLNQNNEFSDWETNCSVQVLPITWRHDIGFQTDAAKDNLENPRLPTLANITVDGVLGLRKLLGDVALDILLYSEPYYKEIIRDEVTRQLNEIYHRFQEREPGFCGEVHFIGHSLGSLILWDILCQQHKYKLDFEIKNYFCVGSPIGVFKLIQRTKIDCNVDEYNIHKEKPACRDLYNIFHVCDPIAYRLEPLVDVSMSQFEQCYLQHWTGEGIASKMLEIGENLWKDNSGKSKKQGGKRKELDEALALKLLDLNYKGRLDFSLPPGFLEVDFISAAKAHISYFEDVDIANFMLKEILCQHKKPKGIHPKTNTT